MTEVHPELLGRLVAETRDHAIVMLDPGGHVETWNAGAQAFTGYRADEIVGEHFSVFLPQQDAAPGDPESQLEVATAEGRLLDEGWRVRKDGTRFWASVVITALRDPEGRLQGFGTVTSDLTERRAHELELLASQERFSLMVAAVQDYAILMLDPGGHIQTWNAGAERFKGYRAEEIIGRHFSEFYPPEDVAAGKPDWELEVAAAEGRLEDEGWRVRKDGTRFWANVVITALRDTEGTLRGYGKVTRDLTERRAHELELLAAHARAVQASEQKSEFVANMSHEIRTPLNGVIAMSDLLLGTPLNPEQREFADSIRISGDALMAVINDVLDFSKIEAGKLEIEDEPFTLRPVVEDVASIVATPANAKGVELITSVAVDLPSTFSGDGNRIRQVLTNLMTNAVKFTAQGEVAVQVTGESAGEERFVLRFEVKDTGIGIDDASLDSIFGAFVQEDGSTTRRFGGTGLGLTISRQLVELMGGRIGVNSVPEVGSEFWFTLPVQVTCDVESVSQELSDLDGTRVLVVDDNATSLGALKRRLASWGLECDTTDDPTEVPALLADATAAGRAYRLAVIDSSMPLMSGSDLVHIIRRTHTRSALTILMLTSSAVERDTELHSGVDGVVTKPVREEKLRDQIEQRLGARRPDPPMRAILATSEPEGSGADRPLVLVAEDNRVNQRVAVALLTKRGFQVEVAANGREAADMSASGAYAAIFMDCQMPLLDGYEATTEIRSRDERIPIIAMTANTMSGDRDRCIAVGMNDYIGKPVRSDDLDQVIARALPEAVLGRAISASRSGEAPRRPTRTA